MTDFLIPAYIIAIAYASRMLLGLALEVRHVFISRDKPDMAETMNAMMKEYLRTCQSLGTELPPEITDALRDPD